MVSSPTAPRKAKSTSFSFSSSLDDVMDFIAGISAHSRTAKRKKSVLSVFQRKALEETFVKSQYITPSVRLELQRKLNLSANIIQVSDRPANLFSSLNRFL